LQVWEDIFNLLEMNNDSHQQYSDFQKRQKKEG